MQATATANVRDATHANVRDATNARALPQWNLGPLVSLGLACSHLVSLLVFSIQSGLVAVFRRNFGLCLQSASPLTSSTGAPSTIATDAYRAASQLCKDALTGVFMQPEGAIAAVLAAATILACVLVREARPSWYSLVALTLLLVTEYLLVAVVPAIHDCDCPPHLECYHDAVTNSVVNCKPSGTFALNKSGVY